MARESWNAAGVATFEHVHFVLGGASKSLSFREFHALPVDQRVRILLEGKPSFWAGGGEVPRARALSRRP